MLSDRGVASAPKAMILIVNPEKKMVSLEDVKGNRMVIRDFDDIAQGSDYARRVADVMGIRQVVIQGDAIRKPLPLALVATG